MGCGSGNRVIAEPIVVKTKPCIVIIGAPGSGTNAQAEKIKEKYKFQYVAFNL